MPQRPGQGGASGTYGRNLGRQRPQGGPRMYAGGSKNFNEQTGAYNDIYQRLRPGGGGGGGQMRYGVQPNPWLGGGRMGVEPWLGGGGGRMGIEPWLQKPMGGWRPGAGPAPGMGGRYGGWNPGGGQGGGMQQMQQMARQAMMRRMQQQAMARLMTGGGFTF